MSRVSTTYPVEKMPVDDRTYRCDASRELDTNETISGVVVVPPVGITITGEQPVSEDYIDQTTGELVAGGTAFSWRGSGGDPATTYDVPFSLTTTGGNTIGVNVPHDVKAT